MGEEKLDWRGWEGAVPKGKHMIKDNESKLPAGEPYS